MLEGLIGQVQQLRGVLLGQHVDREPEVHTATIDLNLVVGVSVPPSDRRSTTCPARTPYLASGMGAASSSTGRTALMAAV